MAAVSPLGSQANRAYIIGAMSDTLTLIAARRREIEAEISRLSTAIDALRAELPDLEAAERVLGRLSGSGGTTPSTPDQLAAAPEPQAPRDASKPPNTPTINDMIVEALRDASARGVPGLQPAAMTRFIARRWWPNVPGVAISPIAWRMWKNNKLLKDGPVYMLPENTEAADLLSEAGSAASRSSQH
jgi:hypothetical protein